MTVNVCPNRKCKPRIPKDVCLYHIQEKDATCMEKYVDGKYKCEFVRGEKKNATS